MKSRENYESFTNHIYLTYMRITTKILIESICSINKYIFNSTTGEIPFTSLKPIPINEDLVKQFNLEYFKFNTKTKNLPN